MQTDPSTVEPTQRLCHAPVWIATKVHNRLLNPLHHHALVLHPVVTRGSTQSPIPSSVTVPQLVKSSVAHQAQTRVASHENRGVIETVREVVLLRKTMCVCVCVCVCVSVLRRVVVVYACELRRAFQLLSNLHACVLRCEFESALKSMGEIIECRNIQIHLVIGCTKPEFTRMQVCHDRKKRFCDVRISRLGHVH